MALSFPVESIFTLSGYIAESLQKSRAGSFSASRPGGTGGRRGATGRRRECPRGLTLLHRQGHEAVSITAFQTEKNDAFAVLLGGDESISDVRRRRNMLAACIEDHVTGPNAALGSGAGVVDIGNHHAFLAGAGNILGRGEFETEPRQVRAITEVLTVARAGIVCTAIRKFRERNAEVLFLAVTHHCDRHVDARRKRRDAARQIACVLDLLSVHLGDDIARLDARLRGRRIRLRIGDKRAVHILDAETFGDFRRDRLNVHAEIAARDLARFLERGDNVTDGLGRYREGYADTSAGRRNDRRIHADHFAREVERRAAGVAAINRGVDLEEIIGTGRSDIAAARGNDASRNSAAEAEGIAYCKHPVADARRAACELDPREAAALTVDLQEREVGARIGADHLRGVGLAVFGLHVDFAGVFDNVIVRHDVAVSRNEEAGALAGDPPAMRDAFSVRELVAEEPLQEAIDFGRHVFIAKVRAVEGHGLRFVDLDLDADDSRANAIDHVGEGVLARGAVGRNLGTGGGGIRGEDKLARGDAGQGKAEYATE